MQKEQFSTLKHNQKKKYHKIPNRVLVLQGFFTYYDKYNRAKLMFLDDYDCDSVSLKHPECNKFALFTKSFIINKSNKTLGNSPLTTDKESFYVNCNKNQIGLIDCEFIEGVNPAPKLVPITDLLQHKVECVVKINNYNFKKNGELLIGWNLKLVKIKLLEW